MTIRTKPKERTRLLVNPTALAPRRHGRGWLHAIALLLAACGHGSAAFAAEPACHDPGTLRFTQIPLKDASSQERQVRPLLAYLEQRLGRPVQRVAAMSYGAVVEGLLAGSYDIAELGPATYAAATERGVALEPLAVLTRQPETIRGYRSVLVVRGGLNADGLFSLANATVALTDPDSTSGALLPRLHVHRITGQALEAFFGRVSFVGSHARALEAVRQRLVDAAFVSSAQLENALREGRLAPADVTVLWQSEPIMPDPYVVRSELCPGLRAAIREALLEPAGALDAWLCAMDRAGFVAVTDDDYRDIRAAWRQAPP